MTYDRDIDYWHIEKDKWEKMLGQAMVNGWSEQEFMGSSWLVTGGAFAYARAADGRLYMSTQQVAKSTSMPNRNGDIFNMNQGRDPLVAAVKLRGIYDMLPDLAKTPGIQEITVEWTESVTSIKMASYESMNIPVCEVIYPRFFKVESYKPSFMNSLECMGDVTVQIRGYLDRQDLYEALNKTELMDMFIAGTTEQPKKVAHDYEHYKKYDKILFTTANISRAKLGLEELDCEFVLQAIGPSLAQSMVPYESTVKPGEE